MNKLWFLKLLERLPGRFKSGYYIKPLRSINEGDTAYHDFRIFNPQDRYVGDISTTWAKGYPPFVESIQAGQGHYTLEGLANSVGFHGTRDLARQVKEFYLETHPGHTFDNIAGIRVSGARAKALEDARGILNDPAASEARKQWAQQRLDKAQDIMAMSTGFKPSVAGPIAGGAGAGMLGLNPDNADAAAADYWRGQPVPEARPEQPDTPFSIYGDE